MSIGFLALPATVSRQAARCLPAYTRTFAMATFFYMSHQSLPVRISYCAQG